MIRRVACVSLVGGSAEHHRASRVWVPTQVVEVEACVCCVDCRSQEAAVERIVGEARVALNLVLSLVGALQEVLRVEVRRTGLEVRVQVVLYRHVRRLRLAPPLPWKGEKKKKNRVTV